MKPRTLAAALLLAGLTLTAAAADPAPPLEWKPPASFDPARPGLGLEQLEGVAADLLYDPKPSKASPENGGTYESILHGTYNHHQQFVVLGDRVIVYWTNHVQDENGPGQRLLARVGIFRDNGGSIDWGKPEEIVELAPPAMPAGRRPVSDDSDLITGAFMDGTLQLIDGRLFLRGRLLLCDGWTDTMLYHHNANCSPVPDEHYSRGRKPPFRFDIYWQLMGFVQEWKFEDGKLRPASELYVSGDPAPAELQVTPSIRKKMGRFLPPYDTAKPLAEAPEEFRKALQGRQAIFNRRPRYAPGTDKLAANGKNGLAHHTEFIRPDGSSVTVRDNLLDPTTYYAAEKQTPEACYGPGIKTNLFGTAMPVAGELPDGTVWFVGSDMTRQNAYITWSKDGRIFDRTRLLLHISYEAVPGISKPAVGGAQYFQAITRNGNIYLVYSIAKEKIGICRIPAEVLK